MNVASYLKISGAKAEENLKKCKDSNQRFSTFFKRLASPFIYHFFDYSRSPQISTLILQQQHKKHSRPVNNDVQQKMLSVLDQLPHGEKEIHHHSSMRSSMRWEHLPGFYLINAISSPNQNCTTSLRSRYNCFTDPKGVTLPQFDNHCSKHSICATKR